MAETLLMFFAEGPFMSEKAFEAPAVLSWPLPDRVHARGYAAGCYVKQRESQGVPAHEGELRGALYIWDARAVYDPRRDGI